MQWPKQTEIIRLNRHYLSPYWIPSNFFLSIFHIYALDSLNCMCSYAIILNKHDKCVFQHVLLNKAENKILICI